MKLIIRWTHQIYLWTNSALTENDNPEEVLYQVAHHEL